MVIRDPVHGDIELTSLEAEILDTREMQRLRGIKQTGAAYLVFPGALHTRFDHSLGVVATATAILTALRKNGAAISQDDWELVRLGALLHDVSHLPFGHTIEDERAIFGRHDRPERLEYFLRNGGIGRVLRRAGWEDAVVELLAGRREQGGRGPADWHHGVIAGAVDADLLDYLRRDAYFCGLRHDYDDRVFSYFRLVAGDRDSVTGNGAPVLAMALARHGLERPDARSEIMHLLRLRYFLTERVYYHHTKIAAGAMIARAVEIAVENGTREEDLYDLNDYTLFRYLRLGARAGEGDPRVAELIRAVEERRLYKRAYVLGPGEVTPEFRRSLIERLATRPGRLAAEAAVADGAGLRPEQVIIYCPAASAFKEIDMPVITPAGVRILSQAEPADRPGEVAALAREYEDLWRLYVFTPEEHVHAVHAGAAAYFGIRGAYEPKSYIR